ncbi:MAG: dihydroorotase [Christensenella sp.]|uniref:dihydroorotase n=1 Tax=Christensenella sp. TaxID=1935934 RepID=UPI002B20B8CF|nr:dihydroorotase [Christensenella sp.]MEA5003333.1 dihydroorotase [Christensenella sp.]
MSLLIKNVTVCNADNMEAGVDILLGGGIVKEMGKNIQGKTDRVIDGQGLYAFPGFVDLHCHLRDPGFTHKEDIVSGTKAAAAGGFCAVCCMPNTKPVADSVETVAYMIKKAQEAGFCEVLPVASITQGMQGKELTDFAALIRAGAVAFSDDGLPVVEDDMILAAMDKAKELGTFLMLHEEDLEMRGQGVVHDGENAKRAGICGIPRAVEECMTARDIMYAERTGAHIHICHVSTEGSVELIRRAKSRGVHVTCESGPHYFSATDEMILDKNPNAKMNPPLREERDRQAVCRGIADGTIDAIATDHAPHSKEEKAVGIEQAPFGIIGFETAFALAVTNLVDVGIRDWKDLARLLSERPNALLKRKGGRIAAGMPADIVLCDVREKYIYSEKDIVSKAKNTPFLGTELCGRVKMTIGGGKITYDRQAD